MQVITEIGNKIIEGKIKEALLKLKDILVISESSFYNEVLMLLSNYNALQIEIRKDIIEHHQKNIRNNKIIDSALSILAEIKENEEIISKYNSARQSIELANKRKNIVYNGFFADSLIHRISKFKEHTSDKKYRILRIGKNLEFFDKMEGEVIRQLGVEFDYANTSKEALELIEQHDYHLIISSVRREGNNNEGFEFHLRLIDQEIDIPFIFYIGFVNRKRGVPPYAFGITHEPNELIHLVIDVLDRI